MNGNNLMFKNPLFNNNKTTRIYIKNDNRPKTNTNNTQQNVLIQKEKEKEKEKEKKSDTLIISFAGYALLYGGIPRFEFFNFLSKHFTNIDTEFYLDESKNLYHCGITNISTDIQTTVDYLRPIVSKYSNVIFLGVSAGGYAAILFGSLLNITSVVAFIPPTNLRSRNKNIEEEYRNIQKHINKTTNYYIYGDSAISDVNDHHHISHCENIAIYPNVHLTRMNGVDMKTIRNNGMLFQIISNAISSRGT
jgi:hypothetical protein